MEWQGLTDKAKQPYLGLDGDINLDGGKFLLPVDALIDAGFFSFQDLPES